MARNIQSGRILLKTQLGLAIIWLCLFSYQNMGAQVTKSTLDFETGDLRGWRKTGNAFDYQPTLDDNPNARDRSKSSRHQGRYWIGTFERFQGKPGQEPGDTQGDRPQGTLTSFPFTIPSGSLSFLIGGGSSFETRVELMVGDPIEQRQKRVYYQTGKNTETMQRVIWDLRRHAGKTGQIRIVDKSSSGWGHINVDDFQFRSFVRVPNVVNQNLDNAKRNITRSKLRTGRVSKEESTQQEGTIIRQEPMAGITVPIDTILNVWVAIKPRAEVPNLVKRELAEARQIIQEARLKWGRENKVETEPEQQQENTIIRQDPNAGTIVPIGTTVNVWVVIKPRPRVIVPDLVKRRLEDAQQIIQKAQLKQGQENEIETEQQEGTIIQQEPKPGTRVPIGTAVNVWVAIKDDKPIRIWLAMIAAASILLGFASYLFLKAKSTGKRKKAGLKKLNGFK